MRSFEILLIVVADILGVVYLPQTLRRVMETSLSVVASEKLHPANCICNLQFGPLSPASSARLLVIRFISLPQSRKHLVLNKLPSGHTRSAMTDLRITFKVLPVPATAVTTGSTGTKLWLAEYAGGATVVSTAVVADEGAALG